jgi:hypothetical protein
MKTILQMMLKKDYLIDSGFMIGKILDIFQIHSRLKFIFWLIVIGGIKSSEDIILIIHSKWFINHC